MTDDTTPLAPDQPDTNNIIRAVFEHGYQRAMLDASRILDQYSTRIGGMLTLEVRTALVEAGMQGGEVHDAILRTNTPAPSETAKQDAGRQDASGGQSS